MPAINPLLVIFTEMINSEIALSPLKISYNSYYHYLQRFQSHIQSYSALNHLSFSVISWSGHEISQGWPKQETHQPAARPHHAPSQQGKFNLMAFIRGEPGTYAQVILPMGNIDIDGGEDNEYSSGDIDVDMSKEKLTFPIIEKIETPDSWEWSGDYYDYSSGTLNW